MAKRLGKTPAWVSQRLALLELTPDLQDAVEAGELKVEPARRIGRLPKEDQASAAEKWQLQRSLASVDSLARETLRGPLTALIPLMLPALSSGPTADR